MSEETEIKQEEQVGATQKLSATHGRFVFSALAALGAMAGWFLIFRQLASFAKWLTHVLLGTSASSHFGLAFKFFIYEVPKVLMLLVLVVFVVGVIRTFFTPERTRSILAGKRESAGNVLAALLGVVTPFCSCSAVGFMTRHLGAGGGIAVTASHNPVEWNALKFFSPEGIFLNSGEMEAVLTRYRNSNFDYKPWNEIGHVQAVPNPTVVHLEKVLGAVDVAKIRAAKFRVTLDLCNGAGLTLIPMLLERLGCEVTTIFADPDKAFERVAEPLAENIGRLCETVRQSHAAIGFAIDPDADRLALVDETGRAIGEERTLTIVSKYILSKVSEPRPIVANLSTTRALDDVAAQFGTTVLRTKIGEAHVMEGIKKSNAWIGGEGNGGIIFPAVHPGRDAATGIALLLAAMAESGKSLSVLNAEIPDYFMAKKKAGIEGKDVKSILAKLRTSFPDSIGADDLDGLKILFKDRWLHVRASGTEPILRIFTEAPTLEAAEELAERGMRVVMGS